MSNLNQYLTQLIESKKQCAAIAKREFDHRSCHYDHLSENELAELIMLAIKEDKSTREDLMSNLQHLLENALERAEEQEEAEQGIKYQNWKQWAISTQLI